MRCVPNYKTQNWCQRHRQSIKHLLLLKWELMSHWILVKQHGKGKEILHLNQLDD
jgi:hypothetical protein